MQSFDLENEGQEVEEQDFHHSTVNVQVSDFLQNFSYTGNICLHKR